MKKPENYLKTLLFVVIVLTTGFSFYIWQFNKADRSADLPILVEADKYAVQIAKYNFKAAEKYSTPENKKTLQQEIKVRMQQIAAKNGLSKLKFKAVDFEKSLLVNTDPDYQIVAEKMVYDTPTKKNRTIYLRFDIKKLKKSYQISNTKLIEIAE